MCILMLVEDLRPLNEGNYVNIWDDRAHLVG